MLKVTRYTDPDNFKELGESAIFPCDTDFMEYNPLTHEYELTIKCLERYGIDVPADKPQEFIEDVSEQVYSYIYCRAGKRNIDAMQYRIAKGYCGKFQGYAARKKFERILINQARYFAEIGDARRLPKMAISDTGRIKANDLKETDGYWLYDGCITELDSLNLTVSGKIIDRGNINPDDY